MRALLLGLHLRGFSLLPQSLKAEDVPKREKFPCRFQTFAAQVLLPPTPIPWRVSVRVHMNLCAKRKNSWQLVVHFNAVSMYFWKSPNLTSSARFHDFPQILQSSLCISSRIKPATKRETEFKNTLSTQQNAWQNTAATWLTKSTRLNPKTTETQDNKRSCRNYSSIPKKENKLDTTAQSLQPG